MQPLQAAVPEKHHCMKHSRCGILFAADGTPWLAQLLVLRLVMSRSCSVVRRYIDCGPGTPLQHALAAAIAARWC